MRLEIDMPEHHYNNIMSIDSVSLGRAPYKGIIMYAINAIKRGRVLEQKPTTKNDLGVDREDAVERLNALKQLIGYDKDSEIVKATQKSLDMAIKALVQGPTTKNDLALIHTEGLDEEIRCTMCTNHMKSDRGCDGSCVVNKDMYKAVMETIEKRIQPTTKNDLVDDCISREAVDRIINKWLSHPDYELKDHIYSMTEKIHNLPSVTPQEPILDKIREQIKSHLRGVEITLEVLVENDPLRPKMEGAKDTLEECLELINKAETEDKNA